MVLPVDYETDWNEITKRKQKRIDENCRRENSKRLDHVYQRGDKLLKVPKKILRKVERIRRGPFTVISHNNNNGTVTIQKGPCFTDSVNIRRVDPFFE